MQTCAGSQWFDDDVGSATLDCNLANGSLKYGFAFSLRVSCQRDLGPLKSVRFGLDKVLPSPDQQTLSHKINIRT